jgi:hypothetical protein
MASDPNPTSGELKEVHRAIATDARVALVSLRRLLATPDDDFARENLRAACVSLKKAHKSIIGKTGTQEVAIHNEVCRLIQALDAEDSSKAQIAVELLEMMCSDIAPIPPVICTQAQVGRFLHFSDKYKGLLEVLKTRGVLREYRKRSERRWEVWFSDREQHEEFREWLAKDAAK